MTQDFAKRKSGKTAAQKKKSTRPSASKSKPPADNTLPAWGLLAIGMVLGVFITLMVQLTLLKTPEQALVTPPTASASQQPARQKPQPAAQQNAERTETKFEFYEVLPDSEVKVQVNPEDLAKQRKPIIYHLQAASFKSQKEADRLRAELILLGMDATIESGTGSNGSVWYRVVTGPFSSRSKMAKARSTLVSRGMHPLLRKTSG